VALLNLQYNRNATFIVTLLIITASRSDKTIKLTFALKQRNLGAMEKLFWEVSTPNTPKFSTRYDLVGTNFLQGKHLSFEQVTSMIAPLPEDIQAVQDWLLSNGAFEVQVHRSKDFLTASMSISTAENLLQTKYQRYQHSSGKTFLKAVDSYSLPASIASKVDFVSGFRFPGTN
jgi:tripeptidyl-peptidase-1